MKTDAPMSRKEESESHDKSSEPRTQKSGNADQIKPVIVQLRELLDNPEYASKVMQEGTNEWIFDQSVDDFVCAVTGSLSSK